ncbi:unnamed protein product [Dovyalis caffra]|uniref:Uncharacterized protein n=1 Tax=Dovyalis caffra TaxID=77055 RepID=A0AAV1RH53_9ROSI|nr:unnamed protein product [Dovyalis caffra]
MLWLTKQRKLLADSIYRVISSSRLLSFFGNNGRWKGSMAQVKLSRYGHMLKFFSTGNIQSWEFVSDDLKESIFYYLLDKRSRYRTGHHSRMVGREMILEERGDQVLKRKGCFEKLGWSVIERDFHESFLLWYIATRYRLNEDYSDSIHCKMSRSLSDYLMYLWSDLPFLLPEELVEAKYKQIFKTYPDARKLASLLHLVLNAWIRFRLEELRSNSGKQC